MNDKLRKLIRFPSHLPHKGGHYSKELKSWHTRINAGMWFPSVSECNSELIGGWYFKSYCFFYLHNAAELLHGW